MAVTITTIYTSTRSLLGPLTTTYTPPQACFSLAQNPYLPIGWAGQGCSSGIIVDTSSCWPPALVSPPGPPYNGWGFYSPGLICPAGYTSACTAALEKSGSLPSSFAQEFSFQFPLIPGETAVGCCPTGFTCNIYGGAQTCVSYMIRGSYLAGICGTSADTLTDFQYSAVPATNSLTYASEEIIATDATFYNPLFQINWQSTDRSTSTSSTSSVVPASRPSSPTSSTLISSSSVVTPSPTSSTLTSSSLVVTPSPSGLSTGVVAAIAAIIPVVILALIGLILCSWFRRRRRYRESAESHPITGNGSEVTGSHPMTISGGDTTGFSPRELYAVPQPQELETGRQGLRHELGTGRQALRQELGTGRQGLANSGYTPVPQELAASRL